MRQVPTGYTQSTVNIEAPHVRAFQGTYIRGDSADFADAAKIQALLLRKSIDNRSELPTTSEE